MFEVLLWSVAALIALALFLAWDWSRDILHPLFFLGADVRVPVLLDANEAAP